MLHLTSIRARKTAAFSLIEVLAALSLALLIVGIAVLSIGSVNEEARLRRVASALEATARNAMQRCLVDQVDQWIELSPRAIAASHSKDRYALPDEARLELRHWGEDDWQSPHQTRWHFSAEGLCEPLQLRLVLGRATMELKFDPLTGAVAEESLIIENG